MSLFRPASVLLAAVLVAATAATDPARAATEPTTLAVDGTVRVVVVDRFGEAPQAEHLYTIETADGSQIPVDLDETVPADARFSGELVVRGEVASDLAEKDLLPKAGSTIDEDTRAGRVAVASAEQQDAPLQVAESTVSPVTAAAVTASAPHKAYVAVMDGRGSIEESESAIRAIVDNVTGYWRTESNGAIGSFDIQELQRFTTSAAGQTTQSCGMETDPRPVWTEAAAKFPGVSFSRTSGNHLIVAMADECAGSGVAGIAEVGTSLSSSGRMSLSMGAIAQQVGVHELGHTFGLGHANLDTCPSADICEYFDLYSPMALALDGNTFTPPALGSSYRVRLGTAGTGEVQSVALTNGQAALQQTFALTPRAGSTGLRGLLVTDPTTGTKYSIDWRTAAGRDAGAFYGSPYAFGAPYPTYPTGVVVEREGTNGEIHLMTRNVSGRAVGSYGAGTAFSPSSGLAVTVGTIGSTASVTVRLGSSSSFQSAIPTISGTPVVEGRVEAEPGAWADGAELSYDWKLGGVSTGVTSRTFDIPASAAGRSLSVAVTGRKTGFTPVTRESGASTVQPATMAAGLVLFSGAAQVDGLVSAMSAAWPSGTTLTWQWQANGVPVPGATSSSFRVPLSLLGTSLRVVATGTRPGYTTTSVASAPQAVAAGRLTTRIPTISGTAKVGRTLKAKTGSWPSRPSYSYQWYANGKRITSKGTRSSFKLTSRQKGKRITVRVTGRKAGYVTVAKASKSTKRVAKR